MHKIKMLVLTTIVTCLCLSSLVAYGVANDVVYITGVNPVPSITLPDWLMPLEDVIALLPPTTTINVSEGGPMTVTLNWISIADPVFPEFPYSPQSSGYYLAIATFELPEGVVQPEPPAPQIPLQVTTTVLQPTSLLPGLYPWATPLTIDFPGFDQPGTYVAAWMMLDGVERTYYYYVPSSYDDTKPVPLVFSLHGYTSCGLAGLLGVDDCAERNGFIAVCPDGLGWMWVRARDVPFISAIIDEMAAEYNLDTRRVYMVGISMGGWMVTNLAYDLADKIAAIGIISGSRGMAAMADAGIPLPRPMSFVITAGTDEWAFGMPLYEHLNARKATSFLVEQLYCDPEPEITYWPDTPEDRTNVTCYAYSGGIDCTEVVYYEVGGGGHNWPGGLQYSLPSATGWVTYHVEAWEDCLWPYLSKHAIPEVFEGCATIKTPELTYEGPAELHICEHAVYLHFDGQWIKWDIYYHWQLRSVEFYVCKGELGRLWVTVVHTKRGSYATAVGRRVFFYAVPWPQRGRFCVVS